MRIAVVTPAMKSGEKGGAEALYEGMVRGLRAAGFVADQVEVVTDESTFDAILDSYHRCAGLRLDDYDVVVSSKAPTYMVRHRSHVSYLLHTIRVFYDMFEHEFGTGTPAHHRQRLAIHALDRDGLRTDRVRGHFANGETAFRRLYDADPFWRDIPFRALHHPPALEGFHAPRRGEYIFLPSRLHRWKRVDLVVKAFRCLKRDVRLKIAGCGEDEAALRELAAGDDRIEFLGRIDDSQVLNLYAGAIAVPFVPQQEDYGLVTIEAFKSQKPVITCADSGEPVRFVRDHETGFVVRPEPEAIAEKLAYLIDHPDHAAQMGQNGLASISHITWEFVISGMLRPVLGDLASKTVVQLAAANETAEHASVADAAPKVAVLDMQPIDPPVGGGRLRLLGLYHGLGLPTTYVGTYDWPGEKNRHHRLSDTLDEIDVPLRDAHFAASADLQAQVNGKTTIDVSFDLLAHHSPEYVDAVRRQAAGADIVVFSHPWVYPLVKDRLGQRQQLVVYDSQNVEGYLRATLLDDGGVGTDLVRHVAALEYELCNAAHIVLACSHEDRLLFHELYGVPVSKVLVVPNGTFTGQVYPADVARREEARQRLDLGPGPVALFLGSAYPPNIEAAEFIIGELAPSLPHVTFAVCGGVGTALKSSEPQEARPNNVRVTGPLSEADKLAYLAASDLAVNPMFSGSGTNVKMFDFMAAGLPIVSTPIGARGIAQGPEPAFLVRGKDEFVAAVRDVLGDEQRGQGLGGAARQRVQEAYSWERISVTLGSRLKRERGQLGRPAPFFSVVVATYERHDHLPELIECLRKQQHRDFEVVIIDQSRRPWEGAERYADLELCYIHTDVKGAVKARNAGAFHARGGVLAFTDDDCRPLPDWLDNARVYFADPSTVGVEGLIVSDKQGDPDYRAVTNQGFEGIGFMTANLLLRRETFNAIHGFDERFDNPHFREDTDLGWRALAHGRIPFGHDVRVYHPPHRRDIERESLAERNRFFEKDALLLEKHPGQYRSLFLREGHFRNTRGFWENFLRGVEQRRILLDSFYRALLPDELCRS